MGTMVKATRREERRAKLTERARAWANFPTIPEVKSMGKKTPMVVKVDADMAIPTSSVPLAEAVSTSSPSSSTLRKIFSMTTTELSTSIPTPSPRPTRVIRFRVYPAT